jgi:hypothetical protein
LYACLVLTRVLLATRQQLVVGQVESFYCGL